MRPARIQGKIMKRFLLFWTILSIILVAPAQERNASNSNSGANEHSPIARETHVTPVQALNVGYTFMRTGGGTRGNNVSKQTMQLVYTGRAIDSLTLATTDCYYVFSLQPKGFVIVAADDRVEPILGYSYDNNFAVANMPDHVRSWLGNYEKQIEAVVKQDIAPEAETTTKWSRLKSGQSMSTRSGESVGPLLTTTWDQGQFYNSMCPEDEDGPDGHVYTGCVATAMAQIVNHHQYPQHGRGTHSYNSNYGTMSVNYDSATYDYANMPVSLTSDNTAIQVNAVSSLMRDCGVATNMGYGSSESSAYDQEVRAALINFFKYSPDMGFAEKSYFSNDEWHAMLRNDLDAGNPVYYSGRGTGGHAFVCDGYNADDYFSFNFGWGGYCNGWYLTSEVNPGDMYFNDSQAAIFGIVPDDNGNVILGQMDGTSTFTVDEPLEFYHLLGHNGYEGTCYDNPCNNLVTFISENNENQIVADIMEYEDQNITIYDGNGNGLRSFYGGSDNDLSPVVSTQDALNVEYQGNFYYAGFKLSVSRDNGCRMVSNIVSSIDATTVHLMWTENGSATQWQIEYGEKGFAHGDGTMMTTSVESVTIDSLTSFTEYDFYIRSVCGNNQYGLWNKVTLMVEAPYWQDVVTSQPEGYVLNETTNTVEISTAEGFAWWAKNGCLYNAYLTSDIDLSGHKWRPIFGIVENMLFGNGHVISNLYINEPLEDVGLFSDFNGIIDNVGLNNASVKSTSYRTGCFCGTLRGIIRNSYVRNSTINGGDKVGGLVGEVFYGTVSNCYVNVNVVGTRWSGLMIGSSKNGIIRNNYAAGSLRMRLYCYNAGIAAYAEAGEISNCYSVKTGMGVVGYKGSTIVDTSTFVGSDSGWTLLTPVQFDEVMETNLLTVLNRSIEIYNDSMYCTWMADTGNINGGYPVFGDKHIVQCPNVTEISVQNCEINGNNAVIISWAETGDASHWRIRYRRHDKPDTVYTYITTSTNPDTVYVIPLGYLYDFNVLALCDSDNRSGWSETQTTIVDLPLWTDIVTSQPVGYVEDADGNVEIYSAEGLAWLAVKTNGFHNQEKNSFEGKTVTLKSDINIEGYRWYPIMDFSGIFDGENHSIANIYMNNESGLFGNVYMGSMKNVILNGVFK